MSPPERGVISVADLSRRLRQAAESATGSDWVQGEISALRRAASGHLYFTLKDEREEACIDCVLYRSTAQRIARSLDDGTRVQVLGRATFWAPRGRLQLVVEGLRPVGRGALLEALERLKAKLHAEGLFDPARKRPLPANPRSIGVVTSNQGAAWHDIRVIALRRASVRLVLSPALVQGDGAPLSLIRALDLLERYPDLDVVIFGRGGGSLEDLMAFNDERVVRRLALCRVPVVSAVGHEIDTTLCDLVADARAATPSEAAERVVPDQNAQQRELHVTLERLSRVARQRLRDDRSTWQRLQLRLKDPRYLLAEKQQYIDELSLRLERTVGRHLSSARERITTREQRLLARHPRAVVAESKARLLPLHTRLRHTAIQILTQCQQTLHTKKTRLNDLSPLSTLDRGYAIVLDSQGRALRRSRDVVPGATLDVRVAEGRLSAQVLDVMESDATEPNVKENA